MLSELEINHIFKYGEHLAELMRDRGILKGEVYFSLLTAEDGQKALGFVHHPNGEPKSLGFILVEDLLNADTSFRDKLIGDFFFITNS
jgi:hypothetical protein